MKEMRQDVGKTTISEVLQKPHQESDPGGNQKEKHRAERVGYNTQQDMNTSDQQYDVVELKLLISIASGLC